MMGAKAVRRSLTAVWLLCLPVWLLAMDMAELARYFELKPAAALYAMPQAISPESWELVQPTALELRKSEILTVPGAAKAFEAAGLSEANRFFCGFAAKLAGGRTAYVLVLRYPNKKLAGGQQWQTLSRVLLVANATQIVQAVELQRYESWSVTYEVERKATAVVLGQIVEVAGAMPELVLRSQRSRNRGPGGAPENNQAVRLTWKGSSYKPVQTVPLAGVLESGNSAIKVSIEGTQEANGTLSLLVKITNKGSSTLELPSTTACTAFWASVEFKTEDGGWAELFREETLAIKAPNSIAAGQTAILTISMPEPFAWYGQKAPHKNAADRAYHFNWQREGTIEVRCRLYGIDVRKEMGQSKQTNGFTGRETTQKIYWTR